MKTTIAMILAGIACTFCAHAQHYQTVLNKANTLSLSLQLNNSSLRVTGTTSDTLSITLVGGDPAHLKDSSGLDLQVKHFGPASLIEKTSGTPKSYLIKVPQWVALAIEEPFGPPQKLEIMNMKTAVSVHSWVSKIILVNNTGPVAVKSEAADIFATLPPGLAQPYSLISSGRLVEITIPKTNKLTLDAEMVSGRFISDFKLKASIKPIGDDSLQTVKAPLNGGGPLLNVKSNTLILHQ